MRILLVDKTVEGQSFLAELINCIGVDDQESLDISVNLAGEMDFLDRLDSADLLILGSEFRESAPAIARKARNASATVEIILFVHDENYASDIFRVAHACRVRKVMPRRSAALDLLQELVSVQELLRVKGRARNGRLSVFLQAKGGVGCSTICAGVAEASLESAGTTALWDFDIESMDLTRSLVGLTAQSRTVNNWVNGEENITKDSFASGVAHLNERLGILPPPNGVACKMDYAGHPEMLDLVQKLVSLMRVRYDNIIVDAAGKMSPAIGYLVRAADEVVVVMDDSIMGLSAAQYYLEAFKPVLKNAASLHLLCSGTKLNVAEISECLTLDAFDTDYNVSFLPRMPFDVAAHTWAGSGGSLFKCGSPETRQALLSICYELGIGEEKQDVVVERQQAFKVGGLFQRVANAF